MNGIALTPLTCAPSPTPWTRLGKSGVRTDSIHVGSYRIHLKWQENQMDGPWYTVTAISRAER